MRHFKNLVLGLCCVTTVAAFAAETAQSKSSQNSVFNLQDKYEGKHSVSVDIPQHWDVGRTEDFTLVLTDSYGDGWDGAMMDVSVNGTLLLDDITVAVSEEIFTLALNDGDLVETVYTAGNYESEHSYAFYDNAGALVISDGPTPGAGVNFTAVISADVYGCMDPEATNYNPEATIDDGSCVYPCLDTVITRSLTVGSYASEVSWDVVDAGGVEVDAGVGADQDPVALCLADGVYTVNMHDSYGDGWNGFAINFHDPEGNLIGTGTLAAGSEGTFDFTVGGAVPVYGCMDPVAINYDSEANTDDGSCFYTGDTCEYPYTGVLGVNSSTGGEQWFALDVAEGFLSVSLPEYEVLQVVGSCLLDEGSFVDFIGSGYQTIENLYIPAEYAGSVYVRIAGWYTTTPMDFDIAWIAPVYGCTDQTASNYNADATVDDGSCTYDECLDNELTVILVDSYGDGWDGASLTIGEFAFTLLPTDGPCDSDGDNTDGDDGECIFYTVCLVDGDYDITCGGGNYASEHSWAIYDGEELLLEGGDPYTGSLHLGDPIVVDAEELPVSYELKQNYPNPFNPSTTINFSLAATEYATLSVFDLSGREVAVLVNGLTESGQHRLDFNASELSSGVYFYRLETASFTKSQKMLLVK